MSTAPMPALSSRVTVRLQPSAHADLSRSARRHRLAAARLARVLLAFGLAELARGNPELKRAIRTTRGG